jgi:hypothetical protein
MKLSIVTQDDRLNNGNLKPEVKERIIDELAKSIPEELEFHIGVIAKQLNVSPELAGLLIKKAKEKWAVDHKDEIELQKEWLRRKIKETQARETNYKFTEKDKTDYIIMLFNQLNSLSSKFGDGDFTPEDMHFVVYGKIGRNMEKILIEQEKNDGTNDSTT